MIRTKTQPSLWKAKFNLLFTFLFVLIAVACVEDPVIESINISNDTGAISSSSVKLDIESVTATVTENDINVASNTLDNDYDTRWSGKGTGVNFIIDLGSPKLVDYVKVAYHKGDERQAYFEAWVRESSDVSWEKLEKHTSSGTQNSLETFDFDNRTVQFVRLKCNGNSSSEWNSITEVEVWGGESSTPVIDITPSFEWQNWYLSVPIDRGDGSGKATSIYYEDIEGYNLTSEEKEYFSINSDGSYNMFAEYTGHTTSGEYDLETSGKYCRTELREYWQGNQTTSDNWTMGEDETHILESTLKVVSCGGDFQTYVAQIHGVSSDQSGTTGSPATVKVLWDDGDLVLEYYTSPDDSDDVWTSATGLVQKPVIATVDNEIFTVKLKVIDGVLQYSIYCAAKELNTSYTTAYDYYGNGYRYENYFKTGNYFRWHDDYDESAHVILYSVATEHY